MIFDAEKINEVCRLLRSDNTRATYRCALMPFVGLEVDADTIQDEVLVWEDLSESTIKTRKAALSKYLKYVRRKSILDDITFPMGRKAQVRRPLTDEEIDKLLGACKKVEELALIEVLIGTGLRMGTVARLPLSTKDGDKIETKRGEKVEIIFTDEMTRLFKAMRDTGVKEYPFGGYYRAAMFMWERIRERAKIEGVTPHMARHTFAKKAFADLGDTVQVSVLMGHKSSETTKRYTHPDAREIAQRRNK